MKKKREQVIELWFKMWLTGKDLGIDGIFEPDCIYVESWGPKYQGVSEVKHWFTEWNTRGRVIAWDIKQFLHDGYQTIVEWQFENKMKDKRIEKFDGVTIIRWSEQGKIQLVKEFGCKLPHYDPYEKGKQPELKNTEMWTH